MYGTWHELLKNCSEPAERLPVPDEAADDAMSDTESVLFALGQAVEQRDAQTAGHCERLAFLSVALGVAIGLKRKELVALYRGGYLHDVGKVGIPDSILLKPDKLNGRRMGHDAQSPQPRRRNLPPHEISQVGPADHPAITMSDGTAPAIPMGCAASRFRCWRASCKWRIFSMLSPARALISRPINLPTLWLSWPTKPAAAGAIPGSSNYRAGAQRSDASSRRWR